MQSIPYDKKLPIKNIHALPAGLRCKYLLCLVAHTGDYVAASWHRKPPMVPAGYVLITFKN